jgi:hypothetical protein
MQERELCSRTVYVTNIDKRLEKEEVQEFFERQCGRRPKAEHAYPYYAMPCLYPSAEGDMFDTSIEGDISFHLSCLTRLIRW